MAVEKGNRLIGVGGVPGVGASEERRERKEVAGCRGTIRDEIEDLLEEALLQCYVLGLLVRAKLRGPEDVRFDCRTLLDEVAHCC